MPVSPTDLKRTVDRIAQQLGETNFGARAQIRRIVERLGTERALAFLEETLEVEAQGGLMLPDGSRRRTPGGLFFYLVRTRVAPEEWADIWQARYRAKKKTAQVAAPPAPAPSPKVPPPPPFEWEDRLRVIGDTLSSRGEATTVKAILIGRPGRVIEQPPLVITTMPSMRVPSLPEGLPPPPGTPTLSVVYIARKQWVKVAEALQNLQDALIIEGYAAYDPELQGIAVFATNVTTKLQQAAKRQAQG